MMRNQTASQTVVIVAMGFVAGTCAVALYQHAGMPGPVAVAAGISAYLLLLTIHAYLWRKESGELRTATLRDRRAGAMRRPQDAALRGPPPMHQGPIPHGGPMPHGGMRPNQMPPVPAADMKARAPLQAPNLAPASQAPMPPPQQQHVASPMPQQAPAAPQPRQAERTGPPPLPATPPHAPASQATGEAQEDFWSFRPAAAGQKLPTYVDDNPSEQLMRDPAMARGGASTSPPPPQRPRATAPREADVEVIQDAIKRLLEEVNAAEQSRQAAPQPQAAAAPTATPPPLPQHAQPMSSPESAIERSIEALRMTAGSMRSAVGESSVAPTSYGAPAGGATSQPPPVPPQYARSPAPRSGASADARARLMADAISAGRIDVTLEPILGLEDQQTRHYEVSVRLRDSDGNVLEVTPEGPDLRGTGLLPLFDGVRVTRTAAVARRLEDRGKVGSVFSTFSGESVSDEHFLGELAETLHLRSSLASQLVLSFTQTDVRGFSTPEWDSLADMRALGFRFAISHMTDLDMDFEALAEQGFVFAKLDAPVFLDGMRAPSGHIPASDVCRHLAKHQLTLVVEHIDDDELLGRVFGFGVLLGQGQLFGGPRPVRAEVANDRARNNAAGAAARAMA